MTSPQRFLTRMIVFLVLTGAIAGAVYEQLMRAFLTNPPLNGLILAVLLFGIVYCLRRVLVLKPEIRWIEAFRSARPGLSMEDAPRLLSPLAQALGEQERRGRSALGATNVRYLLDSIQHRLEESRDISRYLTGLLIFLGLLGTFWGLLDTIGSVGTVISELSVGEGDLTQSFDELKRGLAQPLGGMGIAFSSSLFGLAGSLIVGFLDLQANQAQSTFYDELEEWLATMTRFGGGTVGVEGDLPVPAYIQALLEQTADNLDNLQRLVARAEQGRAEAHGAQIALNERLAALGDQLAAQYELLARMASSQEELRPLIGRLGQGGGMDDATRGHIRNLDVLMSRLVEETSRGRQQVIQELRSEIKMVSRTIAHLAGDPHAAAGE